MNLGSNRSQAGFTLIELIVVITIIAILAAVALPRFAGMQRDARIAKANAILGAIRSAAALTHSRCLLDMAASPAGTCTASGGTANMEGAAITMINQYPTADANGIIAASQIDTNRDGVTISIGGTGANTAITLDVDGGQSPQCRITYATGLPPAGTLIYSPTYDLTTTGC